MNRQDLRELQAVHDYPCLTITLPTHRTFPDNKQDQICRSTIASHSCSGTEHVHAQWPVLKRPRAPRLEH
jgi:hypothetical protein